MNKIPTSKKGLKIAGIFGTITGVSIVIIMRINDDSMYFVLNNMIILIVLIGFIGGLNSAVYIVLEYKNSLK